MSTAHPLKIHSKIKENALPGRKNFACGAPKKEGGLAALAERDPPPGKHPRHLPGARHSPGPSIRRAVQELPLYKLYINQRV